MAERKRAAWLRLFVCCDSLGMCRRGCRNSESVLGNEPGRPATSAAVNPTSKPGEETAQSNQYTTPASPEPANNGDEVMAELWAKAVTKLQNEDQEYLAGLPKTISSSEEFEKLKGSLQNELERVGTKGQIADRLDKTVSLLNKVAVVGDIMVSSDPVIAAFPWAAMRFVLTSLGQSFAIRDKIIEGIAKITNLLCVCAIYRKLYLPPLGALPAECAGANREVITKLESTIVEVFIRSLRFIHWALHREAKRTKYLTDMFSGGDLSELFKELSESEISILTAAELCAQELNYTKFDEINRMLSVIFKSTSNNERALVQEKLQDCSVLGATYGHVDNQDDGLCHPTTRENVLQSIRDWLDDPQGTQTFWLQGMAGTGKTTVSRTIAREFKEKLMMATFFFKGSVHDRSSGKHIFTTLSHQLAQKDTGILTYIAGLMETSPAAASSEMSEQFEKFILEAIDNLSPGNQRNKVVLIVDALDECLDEDHQSLIIEKLSGLCQTGVKLLLTSRNEAHIRAQVKKAPHKEYSLDEDTSVVKEDIYKVLRYEIKKFVNDYNGVHEDCKLEDDWPGDDSLQRLAKIASPLFIAATIYVRFIKDKKESPQNKLKAIFDHSIKAVSQMEKVYGPILTRMGDVEDDFQLVAGSIVTLADPMTRAALANLLGVTIHDIYAQIDPLRSVISVPDIDVPITTVHPSFREYMVSAAAGKYQVQEANVHRNLAKRCLQVMKDRLRTDICGLGLQAGNRLDLNQETLDTRLPEVLRYACLYWAYHLKKSGQVINDNGCSVIADANSFLRVSFQNWLEVLCLIGRVDDSEYIIDDAASNLRMSQFAHDAKRFIRHFRAGIRETPLQIYYSGVLFSPQTSIVPHPLKDRRPPACVAKMPSVDPHWVPYLQVLTGHSQKITSVAFLMKSKYLISGSTDRTIKIWDPVSGLLLSIFEDHELYAIFLTTWGEGKFAAVLSDGSAKLFKWRDGKILPVLQILTGYSPDKYELAFSDDGKYLRSVLKGFWFNDKKECKIYELKSGDCLRVEPSRQDCHHWAASNTNQWLAETDGTAIWVSQWGATHTTERHILNHKGYKARSLAFSPDGKLLAADCQDWITIWDTATTEHLKDIEHKGSNLTKLKLTTDRLLVIYTHNNIERAFIAPISGNSTLQPLQSFGAGSCAFSPNGELFVTSHHRNGTLTVWDIVSVTSPAAQTHHGEQVKHLTFMDNGKMVVSTDKYEIKIWDVSRGICKQTITYYQRFPKAIVGARNVPVFSICSGFKISVWRPGSEEDPLIMKIDVDNDVFDLALSDGGDRLAFKNWFTNNGDRQIPEFPSDKKMRVIDFQVWDIRSRKRIQRYCHGRECSNSSVAISPDGGYIAYGSVTTIEVRNLDNNLAFSLHKKPDQYTTRLRFSSDNKRIIGYSPNLGAEIWDVESQRSLGTWLPNTDDQVLGHPLASMNWESILDVAELRILSRDSNAILYSRSGDTMWITRSGEKLIWLPPDYQSAVICIWGAHIVFGLMTGRVVILQMR